MKKLSKDELYNVNGGALASATMISALARAGKFLYDLGRNLGTAITMVTKKKSC